MRYAVTGGTGFVGGAVVRLLRHAGHDVVALVRTPNRAAALTDAGASLVEGDLGERAALDQLCSDVDGLFHIAGWYKVGGREPQLGWRINVDGTRRMLDAAQRAAVPRVVYTSTLAVNSDTRGEVVDESYIFTGDHLSVYDETKARAHDVASSMAAQGMPLVVVMPGLVYGPADTSQTGALIEAVMAGRRPAVPAGGGVCWGYVDDIARGHLLAMDKGSTGEAYMLAGERASLADGLRLVAKLAGTKGPIVVPSKAVRSTAELAARLERWIALPALYAAESMRASLATYFGNPAKAERELGWSCRPLRSGLAELLGWPRLPA